MEDYIKCELRGEGSPRHLDTFSNLFIVSTHCSVAIVDCTHVGSAISSFVRTW